MSEEGRSTPTQPLPPGAPAPYQERRSSGHGQGWLIVVGLVFAFAVGGLAAAIISKGDDQASSSTPNTVVQQSTTTVTTPGPNITLAPDVTLAPDGTPAPIQGGDDGSDSTGTGATGTTTSP